MHWIRQAYISDHLLSVFNAVMYLLVAENVGRTFSDWPTAALTHLNNNNNIATKSNSSFIYVLTQLVKGQI
jgi:hypothetical protein